MKIILNNTMLDAQLGRLNKDQVIDMPENKANFYVLRGYAKLYVAKVIDEQPVVEVTPKKRTKKTKVIEQ